MGKRPKKSVVLFLVEGKTEEIALKVPISEIYEKIDPNIIVEFAMIDPEKTPNPNGGGDITSDKYTTARNINNEIYDLIVDRFLKNNKYYPKDLHEVIQITDLDGAYIPESAIIENFEHNRFIYNNDGIITNSKNRTVKRNRHKCWIINKLLSMNSIKFKSKTIKYSLYFFSSNLDHFINYDPNLSSSDKYSKADIFLSKYIDNGLEYFFKLFCEDEDALQNMTYEESWDYITDKENPNLESIKRHTNFNILLNKLREQM